MKKSKLLSLLAVVTAAAATLALPVTAAASPVKHEEARMVLRGDHRHAEHVRPVHNVERRHGDTHWAPPRHHHGHARWAPPRHRHGHGHQYRYVERYEHRPVERYEHRYDYRPVERYEPRHDSDVRVRISYDLHL